jgi:hypothetical protein
VIIAGSGISGALLAMMQLSSAGKVAILKAGPMIDRADATIASRVACPSGHGDGPRQFWGRSADSDETGHLFRLIFGRFFFGCACGFVDKALLDIIHEIQLHRPCQQIHRIG